MNTIDATRRSLGRVASEAAFKLMGKHLVSYTRNMIPTTKVTVTNVSRILFSPKKLRDKEYIRHSGFPGGQKVESLEQLIGRRGYTEVMKKAVYGMLPDNKLRKKMMLNLTITE